MALHVGSALRSPYDPLTHTASALPAHSTSTLASAVNHPMYSPWAPSVATALTPEQMKALFDADPLTIQQRTNLGDTTEDVNRKLDRQGVGYTLSQNEITTNRDLDLAQLAADAKGRQFERTAGLSSSLAELLRQAQNAREDIPREAGRAQEDIASQRGDVLRGYERLALGQTGAIRQAQPGGGSGALLQAKAAREANQAHDVHPFDVQSGRVSEDAARNLSRLDYAVQQGTQNIEAIRAAAGAAGQSEMFAGENRIKSQAELALARLGFEDAPATRNPDGSWNFSGAGQSALDLQNIVPRAVRDEGIWEAASRAPELGGAEAARLGLSDTKASNEFYSPQYGPYRVVMKGGVPVRIRPDGTVIG